MKNVKFLKIASIFLVLLFSFSLIGCGAEKKDEQGAGGDESKVASKPKVAILLPGNINDNGWNASAYEGLKQSESEFGIEVAYQEAVAQSDQEEVYRNFATNGYNLIIGHGYQFQDVAKKVAEEFPDIKFAVLNGSVSNGKNLASYSFTNWEPGYIAGVLAALTTKTNSIGAIGAEEIPVIKDNLDALKLGAESVNPNIKVSIAYVGTWDDVAKGKETALAMFNSGADIVACNANAVGLGSIEAAKQVEKYAIGFVSDQFDIAPETVIGSAIQSNTEMVHYVVQATIDGKFEPKENILGIKDKVEGLTLRDWENKLPKETIEKVKAVEQDIIAGKISLKK